MSEIKITGPWALPKIESYLSSSLVPLKLSMISPRGWPVLASLWFFYKEGKIICASRKKSRVIKLLSNNNRCAFEVSPDAPPYHGVRGQGLADLEADPNGMVLEHLHDRFLGRKATSFRSWLMKGASQEVIISITPSSLMSWDYRDRMDLE